MLSHCGTLCIEATHRRAPTFILVSESIWSSLLWNAKCCKIQETPDQGFLEFCNTSPSIPCIKQASSSATTNGRIQTSTSLHPNRGKTGPQRYNIKCNKTIQHGMDPPCYHTVVLSASRPPTDEHQININIPCPKQGK